tara:strand:+ start:1338 stop:1760 length:423 start_codon:yes stop_codon:yes gene_type:complete
MDKTNKIIAEFMGNEKFWLMLEQHNGIYPNFNKTYYQSGDDKTIDKPLKEDYVFKHVVKFHSSWDWLMQVVEKIEEIFIDDSNLIVKEHRYEFDMKYTQCNIYDHVKDCVVASGDMGSKLLSTYQAVVEFIKDYNNGTEQ